MMTLYLITFIKAERLVFDGETKQYTCTCIIFVKEKKQYAYIIKEP